jgi:SAM-dependent methyltransferase
MDDRQHDLHSQLENNHWWFIARREIIRRLLFRVVPPSNDFTVVEVGCGTGGNLAYFSRFYRSIGIDISPLAVAAARRRCPNSLVVRGANPTDLPARQHGEKRVWLFLDVLEHIEDEFSFFGEFAMDIDPRESIVITVPANPKMWSPHDVSFGHYRRYTRESLVNVWDGLSFEKRLLSYFNSRLYPLIRLVRVWTKRGGKAKGQAGTDFNPLPSPLNKLLYKIFSGESNRLLKALDGHHAYNCGASLIAVLTKKDTPSSSVVKKEPGR